MTEQTPEPAKRAFRSHDAYEEVDEGTFEVTTTAFDATVTAQEDPEGDIEYVVRVAAPMLDTAVVGETVGQALEEGWFETYERRLEDAPNATRATVDLRSYEVGIQDGDAVATYVLGLDSVGAAPRVLKAIAEYAEGTYLEGIVPGFEYDEPVAGLLQQARQSGDDESGSGPLPL
jgi:hypothetical protein